MKRPDAKAALQKPPSTSQLIRSVLIAPVRKGRSYRSRVMAGLEHLVSCVLGDCKPEDGMSPSRQVRIKAT